MPRLYIKISLVIVFLLSSFLIYAQIDANATPETRSLYSFLKDIASQRIVFGHQNYSLNGKAWKDLDAVNDKSDCKTSVGVHPAILGLNYNHKPGVLRAHIVACYKRGGIVTMHWPMANPVTGNKHNDRSEVVVSRILPGGDLNNYYKKKLDTLGNLANSLIADNGILVPVIFRPFHENTTRLFWWGKGNCTAQEYKDLFSFTVKYLKDSCNVHNFLYVFSPSRPTHNKAFDIYYPGDDVVDIVAFDLYDPYVLDYPGELVRDARTTVEFARQHNKIAAIGETGAKNGLDNTPDSTWFISRFLDPILQDSLAHQVAYMLVWQNTGVKYWVPVPGDDNFNSFAGFYNDTTTVFLDDLPQNVYTGMSIDESGKTTTENLIVIFPNPAIDGVSLVIDVNKPQYAELTVSDLMGKIVVNNRIECKKAGRNNFRINLSHLIPGTYYCIIQLEDSSKLKSGKIFLVD